MQKVFNAKLITVLVITVLCVFLTLPTFQYFMLVGRMGDNPSPELKAQHDEMLRGSRVIKLGLDLRGGADFLLALDLDRLTRRQLERDTEALRIALLRTGADVTVRPVAEPGAEPAVSVTVNNSADTDNVRGVLEAMIGRDVELEFRGQSLERALAAGPVMLHLRPQFVQSSTAAAMEGALKVVRRRVDEFGLTQPIVTPADADRIRVQIPGETNPAQIRDNLLKTAQLEFRLLHEDHDNIVVQFVEGGRAGIIPGVGSGPVRNDLLEEVPSPSTPGVMIKTLKKTIPGLPDGYVLRLGPHNVINPATGLLDKERSRDNIVYVVRSSAPLTGENLRRAAAITDLQDINDPIKVSIEFDARGAAEFARITEEAVGKRFAILLDDVVYSAPRINEPILGGRAQISGGFTQTEARDLATVLRAGALPAPLRIIEENLVGASLGADSIRDSGKALIIGGVLIIALMITVYAFCGVISVFAMALNVLLIMAILSLMGATLTLSGIGGILLTMGMAVDANILIYERLREELASGKPLRAAINAAFDRAFSVIFDANLTSMLPALVLVLFEVVDGSVKGFWTALAIGLVANLYTGIVVTRALIEAWYAKTRTLNVGKLRFLQGVNIDWMRYRVVGIAFSGSLTVASIGYLVVAGPSFGVDFTGGVLSTVEIKGTTNADQAKLRDLFDDEFHDVKVIKVINKEQWQITLPQTPNPTTKQVPTLEQIKERVAAAMANYDKPAQVLSSQSIDPAIGKEFKVVAISSVIVACLIILTYLAFRFQWIFGAGAVLALLHDIFLSLGVFKMLGHTLTLDIVSGLLIILGYSVNDTIVVFDRIREKMQDRLSASLKDVINAGINETLGRTVLTSGSTFIAVGTMYLFGGSGLSDFALILLLGIFFGTYSSIFIASGLVYLELERTGRTTVIAARKAVARVAVPRKKQNVT